DGEAKIALPVLTCLAEIPGLKIHVLSKHSRVLTRFSRYRDSFRSENGGLDELARIDVIRKLVETAAVDVILPVSESGIRFAATYRDSLTRFASLSPIPDKPVIDMVNNKWSLAEYLADHDLEHPPAILYTGDNAFWQRLKEVSFPVLLKPTAGSSGHNIHFFDDCNSLSTFLSQKEDYTNNFIVQSYVYGHDIDCSILCRDGDILAYTTQKGVIANPRRFGPPWTIDMIDDDETLQLVRRLVQALNFSGIAHIDLRFDEREKRVKLIEINTRFWTSLFGSLAAGVNFPYLACLAGMSIDFPAPSCNKMRFVVYRPPLEQVMTILRHNRSRHSLPVFKQTGWEYIFRDPLPFAMEAIGRRFRGVSDV
ncbi:MAG: ATP-grasp domain-containing protein, partial [Dehalococcoidia bacterium]